MTTPRGASSATFAFPDRAAARPAWLVTLADLALLLVGFFVLLQAHSGDRAALASGLRQGFAGDGPPLAAAPVVRPSPAPFPVAIAGTDGFAPGSAALPRPADAAIAWARDAAADPRTTLTITGYADGTPADVDPATASGTVLAADRARALAAALAAAGIARGRLSIATATAPGRRAALLTITFAGSRP